MGREKRIKRRDTTLILGFVVLIIVGLVVGLRMSIEGVHCTVEVGLGESGGIVGDFGDASVVPTRLISLKSS
jgi:hypothetical protein